MAKIFFISGPSGVGKGTLIAELRKKFPNFFFPPSCTTREMRPGEVDGKTYFFVSRAEFLRRIDRGEFLEWARVHGGNFYGTLKKPILSAIEKGQNVIREFDVQGFDSAKKILPREIYCGIFLRPADSIEKLVERISARAPISDEEISARIFSMKKELAAAKNYDAEILSENGEIEKMVAAAEKIIAENLEN